jgi:hypothetical protein
MSDYLIRELGSQANIDVRYRTEVVDDPATRGWSG